MKTLPFPRKEDWVASLAVLIIAIPLSLGVAVASGGSPAAGLIAAIIGGIVVGALAGAPLTVTGPSAGLTAFVFQIIQSYGIAGLAAITVMSGLFQITFGLCKFGRFFSLVPKPILEGLLSAIGLTIVMGQAHVILGAPIPKTSVDSFVTMNDSLSNAVRLSEGFISPILICAIIAISVQALWARSKKLSQVPAALPAVIAATLVTFSWSIPRIEFASISSSLEFGISNMISLRWLSSLSSYIPLSLGLAFISSSISLLTVRAVDTLAANSDQIDSPNLDKELVAQGVGNAVSGLIGGLPVSAVIARSVLNVKTGAKSRWSTILHAIWIAISAIVAPFALKYIPVSALSAVVILTGLRLLNVRRFLEVWDKDRVSGLFWLVSATAMLLTNLLYGLVLSVALYLVCRNRVFFRYLKQFSRVSLFLIFVLMLLVFHFDSVQANPPSPIRFPGEDYRSALSRNTPELGIGRLETSGLVLENQTSLSRIDISAIPQVANKANVYEMHQKIRDTRSWQWNDMPYFKRRLPWLYPDDGCYLRTDLMVKKLHEWGYQKPKQIFAFGDLSFSSSYQTLNWWYHVAPIVRVSGEVYVIDPSIDYERPLLLQEWVRRISGSTETTQFALCEAGAIHPNSLCMSRPR